MQYEFAGAFFAELARHVRSVVVSPGSRSTPLVLSAVEHPSTSTSGSASGMEPIVVLDERSAGFVALGLAKASRQPVALVCTSGTAAANYLPAVVEAFHSRLPLVVITADRPASYHDWGSPQTIFQNGLYARHVRWATEVAVPRHSPAGAGRLTALRAVENACGPPGGPVHINWPLEKPLEPPDAATSAENREARKQIELEKPMESPDAATSAENREAKKQAELEKPMEPPDAATLLASETSGASWADAELLGASQAASQEILPQNQRAERSQISREFLPPACLRGLIVVGHGNLSDAECAAVARFAEAAGWPIAAEASSGMRFGDWNSNVLSCAHFLFSNPSALPQPEVAIRVGGHHLDRALPRFLNTDSPQTRIVVAPPGCWDDPAFLADHFIHGDIAAIFNQAAEAIPDGAADSSISTGEAAGDMAKAESIPDGATDSSISAGEAAGDMTEAESIPDGATDSSWLSEWKTADSAAAKALESVLGGGSDSTDSEANTASSPKHLTEIEAVRILCETLCLAEPAGERPSGAETSTGTSTGASAVVLAGASKGNNPATDLKADSGADSAGRHSASEGDNPAIDLKADSGAEFAGRHGASKGDNPATDLMSKPILYTSSSLPIRHLEYFAAPAEKPLRVLANRGANGIDGIISSACGAALSDVTLRDAALLDATLSDPTHKADTMAFPTTTVLLGDLALLHDIGGLLTAAQLGISLRLVVLNNNGGAIFSQLPIAEAVDADTFTKFFRTPHNLDLSFVGHLPGVRHIRPSTADELRSALSDCGELASEEAEIAVIEVQTDAAEHMAEMKRCYEAVAASLSGI